MFPRVNFSKRTLSEVITKRIECSDLDKVSGIHCDLKFIILDTLAAFWFTSARGIPFLCVILLNLSPETHTSVDGEFFRDDMILLAFQVLEKRRADVVISKCGNISP